MNGALWFGAVTTLAGAALGGAISLALNRQQMKDARAQRTEEDLRERYRRSVNRRFDAYAEFITQALAYRNAIRVFVDGRSLRPSANDLNVLATAADAASSRVFMVLENQTTFESCRAILAAIRKIQSMVNDGDSGPSDDL